MPADNQLPLPKPVGVIRENHDVVVEFQLEGHKVGEINFSSIMGNWFEKLGWMKRESLKVV